MNNDLFSKASVIAGVEQWAKPEYDVICCSELDLSSLRWWPYWEKRDSTMDGERKDGT